MERVLQELLECGVALEEGGHYLGLALSPRAPDPPLEVRRGRFRRILNQTP